MPARVVLSPEAVADVRAIRAWYRQAGAGPRARQRLLAVLSAIEGLAESARLWPPDPLCPGTRMRVIEEHVVRFEWIERPGGSAHVYVHRIFGPGMQRTAG